MNDELQILITGDLNMGSTVKTINEKLRALAKHPSLQKLDIKINVDDSFVKTISKFIESTRELSLTMERQNRIVNETTTTYKRLDGSIEKVKQQQLASGAIITNSNKKIDEHKQKLAQETAAYDSQKRSLQQLEKELEGYYKTQSKTTKNKLGEVTGSKVTYQNDTGQKVSVNVDKDGMVKNYSQLSNYIKQTQSLDRDHYNALKANKDKLEAMDKLHYMALQQNREFDRKNLERSIKEKESLERAHYNALKTEQAKKESMDKAHFMALQQNSKRETDFLRSKQQMEIKLNESSSKYSSLSQSGKGIADLQRQLSNLTPIGNYKKQLSELDLKLKAINSSAKIADSKLSGAFSSAAGKVAIWAAVTASVYGPINALREMTQVIIDVDTQMTQLRRVMSDSTDFEGMLSRSIELANELGRSIKDVNENAIGFARMGFDESDTMNLARTTTLLQNISELTPQEAVDTLTAAMTIYNVEASKSIEIANKLNEVNSSLLVQQCA